MAIELELQIASEVKTLPHPSQFREWISESLSGKVEGNVELTIRVVDKEEITELNHKYRKKNKATNVLAFPSEINKDINFFNLGDIVICAPVIEEEAKKADKELLAHWAHIVVHGALHIVGFDHQTDKQAKKMEALETKILGKLGFPPPYGAKAKNE